MATNLTQFIRGIRQHRRTISLVVLPEYQGKIALDALARVVLKTPVDTGAARGNWQLTTGKSAVGPIAPMTLEGQLAQGQANIAVATAGDVYLISNSIEYIIPLENGRSGQAPAGMVGVTVAELRAEQG